MKKKFSKIFVTILLLSAILSVFSGCLNSRRMKNYHKDEDGNLKPVTLKFYFYGDKKTETDNVWKTIADKYRDKLNVDFDVSFIPGNDYKQKIIVMSASGESWDMNFDADWLSYNQMVSKDAYLTLNDLLPRYAPDLYAAYQKNNILQAATVNGKIKALPWTMKMNQRPFFSWRKDLSDKEGLNIQNGSVKTIEDVDKALTALREANPDVKIMDVVADGPFQLKYNLGVLPHGFVFDLNDPTCRAVPYAQTAAYKEKAMYAKKWQEEGIIWKDVLVDTANRSQMIKEGKLISNFTTHEWIYAKTTDKDPPWDRGFSEMYPDKKYANRTALANVAVINKNANNPERTLMFLNLLEIDRELYDMVQYGIEGKTYVLNEERADYPTGMNSMNSNYMEWGGQWAFWRPQFMRPNFTYGLDFWKKEAEYASQGNNVISPLDGFYFDITNVKNEVTQIDQITGDAEKLISAGFGKDDDTDASATIAYLISRQKAAGIDKVQAELQRQINVFLANKK